MSSSSSASLGSNVTRDEGDDPDGFKRSVASNATGNRWWYRFKVRYLTETRRPAIHNQIKV